MKPIVENKVKQTMTDLLTLSVGESWASTLVGHIINDVIEEMEWRVPEDVSINEITTEFVQSVMGEVLDRRLYYGI